MKKIYVMAAFLGATSFAFNQVALTKQKVMSLKNASLSEPSTATKTDKDGFINNYSTKAVGTEYFSSDFNDESDWILDGDGLQGDWVINDVDSCPTYTNAGNPLVVPMKTTPGDNFAWFDGVQFVIGGSSLKQNSWLEISDTLDLSSESSIVLRFTQSYVGYNYDATYVEMSTDAGATWTSTEINTNVGPLDAATKTSFDMEFDPAGSTEVLFRFRLETTQTNPQYDGSIMWQIDDVIIAGLADNDLQADDLYVGSDSVSYHKIPLAQVAPIDGAGYVTNIGVDEQTNVKFKAAETNFGTYTSESNPVNIVAGASSTLSLNNTFTPGALGDYKIEYSLEADLVDDIPNNNTFKDYEFSVVEHIYARDNSSQAENGVVINELSTYGLASGDLITKYAVAYDIYADAEITAVDFQFGNTITEGGQVVASVYEADLETLVEETEFYDMQLGDEGAYKTLKFDNPPTLVQGNTYWVQVQIFSDSASIASAGEAPLGTSIFYAGTSWGNLAPTNPTYVIRMNFDPTVGIENNELSNLNVSQNFPNPFANETTVMFNLKEASDVSYTVVDLTGKVVANVDKGNTMAGEHEITIDGTSFANGVYYLNISAGDTNVTRKMIVNK